MRDFRCTPEARAGVQKGGIFRFTPAPAIALASWLRHFRRFFFLSNFTLGFSVKPVDFASQKRVDTKNALPPVNIRNFPSSRKPERLPACGLLTNRFFIRWGTKFARAHNPRCHWPHLLVRNTRLALPFPFLLSPNFFVIFGTWKNEKNR